MASVDQIVAVLKEQNGPRQWMAVVVIILSSQQPSFLSGVWSLDCELNGGQLTALNLKCIISQEAKRREWTLYYLLDR